MLLLLSKQFSFFVNFLQFCVFEQFSFLTENCFFDFSKKLICHFFCFSPFFSFASDFFPFPFKFLFFIFYFLLFFILLSIIHFLFLQFFPSAVLWVAQLSSLFLVLSHKQFLENLVMKFF